MKESMLSKMIVLGVVFVFLGTAMSVLSSETQSEKYVESMGCGSQIVTPYGTYYVMDYIPESPVEEMSPVPEVTRSLPTFFSWKDVSGEDWTTTAKNQASCGSCWAFGSMSALEGVINIAWDDPDLDVDTAEQYILSCLPMSGSCGGGDSYAAFKLILGEENTGNNCNGIIPEECFPYQANSNIPCSEKCDDWESKLMPLTDCGFFRPNFPEDIDAIKSIIMDKGPVVTYFLATRDFSTFFGSHHSPDDYFPYTPGSGANHAVSIVGWKDDPAIGNGGYWIVKNSWGTDWGYDGFFNMEYGCLNIDDVQITWVDYEANAIASFSFEPTNPLAGDSIEFMDTSLVLGADVVSWTWDFDDGSFSTYQNPTYTFEANGVYEVTLTIEDEDGRIDSFMKNVYVGDQIPPESTLALLGNEGDNGWYTSGVKVNITGTDNFAGINTIYYNLDNKGYVPYSGQFSIFHDGEHTFAYYAVDNAGNEESVRSVDVNVDRFDPVLNVSKPNKNTLYLFDTEIFYGLPESIIIGAYNPLTDALDETSGINRVEFTLNHELYFSDEEAPFTCTVSYNQFGYHCILGITAYDNAGRSTTEKVNYLSYCFGVLGK